ncbi:ScbA/BarX family gamma-butyrolactone biosynthesis protein [Rhodococcus sp. H29-C3]|uniref:ScbA/BarX family gamma-butyrolactone biosynthesis protein n=1 Tax=Rhodococcus sp. H29-C3 TaxID=3046307 RepID=UPI0024B898ED|nr:ScbA/BarX family gamma-butyrolactone biosynthesis protein [Rhodococcus sp. H29-C3]MDJ0362291.1 ScbA/BarX family gamma-butyrolactone biosynthesis protein [Rhodococcus sp. H29-C3]
MPRQLVHRQAVAEVFLTDYSAGPGPAYEVAVQLPLSHRIFDASGGEHDPLGVAEAFRQTVVLLCHTSFDVPLHYRFLMESFSVKVLDTLRTQSGAAPLTFRLAVNDVTRRDGAVSGVDVSGILTDGARDIARCSAVARGVSPEGYRRIRQGRDDQYPNQRTVPPGTAVVTAERVGRSSDRDTLISADDAHRTLFCTPDPHNFALFDHPVDHIPGMVLFEAARQALRYCSGEPAAQVAELSAVFPRFTEWRTPCEVSTTPLAAPGRANVYCIRFTQDQALTAELELTAVLRP